MNNTSIMNMVRQADMTKRQAIRSCQNIARELEDRMAKARANPYVRSWSPEFGTPHELSQMAFAHSIVHAGK